MNQESLFRGRCQEIVGEGDDRGFKEGVSRKVSRSCWGRRRWAGESWGSPRLCVSRIQTQLPPWRWRGSSKQAHQLISAPPSSYPTLPLHYPPIPHYVHLFATFPSSTNIHLPFLLTHLTPIHITHPPNIKRRGRLKVFLQFKYSVFLQYDIIFSSFNQIPQIFWECQRHLARGEYLPSRALFH